MFGGIVKRYRPDVREFKRTINGTSSTRSCPIARDALAPDLEHSARGVVLPFNKAPKHWRRRPAKLSCIDRRVSVQENSANQSIVPSILCDLQLYVTANIPD